MLWRQLDQIWFVLDRLDRRNLKSERATSTVAYLRLLRSMGAESEPASSRRTDPELASITNAKTIANQLPMGSCPHHWADGAESRAVQQALNAADATST